MRRAFLLARRSETKAERSGRCARPTNFAQERYNESIEALKAPEMGSGAKTT
jgi:hypothetical protein